MEDGKDVAEAIKPSWTPYGKDHCELNARSVPSSWDEVCRTGLVPKIDMTGAKN